MGGYGKGLSSGYQSLLDALVEAGATEHNGTVSINTPLSTVKVVLEVGLGEITHESSFSGGSSYSVEVSVPGADGKIQLPAEKLVLLSSLTKKPKKNPLSK